MMKSLNLSALVYKIRDQDFYLRVGDSVRTEYGNKITINSIAEDGSCTFYMDDLKSHIRNAYPNSTWVTIESRI